MGMEDWGRDIAFAARALARRPTFTLVAVVTLAIGIGANTTIFSVVDGVLLRPLPYPHSDRIGILWHEFGDGAQNLPAVHALDVRDYRARSRTFESFTMGSGREWILGDQDDAEMVDVGVVEAGFFEFFGAEPEIGRTIQPTEDVPGAAPVVVLSHRVWVRRFGADPAVVGRHIQLAGTSMEVVGVLPEWFHLMLPPEAFLLRDAEVWVSARIDPEHQQPRNYTVWTAFGRLRPGVTFAAAQDEMDAMAARLREEHPEHAASGLQARVEPLLADVVRGARGSLVLLLGAVGFVLLIACANVANLLLVRGQARSRELSLRAALGSGRAGLVRLSLAESALLAVLGGGLGLGVASGSLRIVTALGRGTVPRLDAVRLDGTVLAFVAGLCVLSTFLFGLLPALRASSGDPAEALAAGGRGGGTRARGRARDALVTIEVMASLVLLVGTGLMIRSFTALGAVDPGFATDHRLTFRVALPYQAFSTPEARRALEDQVRTDLEALPDVQAVGVVSQLPLTGSGPLQPYAYDEETASNWESVSADRRWVTPGFFDAIGARLVAGRDFTSGDAVAGNIVIDDRLAAQAFPGLDPIGRALQVNPSDAPERIRYATVVGVVEHLRLHDLRAPHLTQIYWPSQGLPQFSVVVRTTVDPAIVAPRARDLLHRLAPGAPVEDVRTLDELVRASLAPTRLALVLMGAFGAVAVLLACVGLYGVLSNVVAGRTHEIGVRRALGESPGGAVAQILGRGLRLVAVALVLGLPLALLLSRALSATLFGVSPWDPPTYAAASAVLLAVAALACWVPARRATRVDPREALRSE